jgi:hypothetical protein
LRDVLAKKEEKTVSTRCDPHFGHLMRFRSRWLMDMASENFFRQPLQRKSYVGMSTLLNDRGCSDGIQQAAIGDGEGLRMPFAAF